MNKKGQVETGKKLPYLIIAYIVIGFTAVALVVLFYSYKSRPLQIDEQVYVTLYTQRFLNSPECFTYRDSETGNTYPGVIEKSKFSETRLNSCYTQNNDSNFEFILTLDDGSKKDQIQTANYAVFRKQATYPVLIFDKGSIFPGKLLIGIQGLQNG